MQAYNFIESVFHHGISYPGGDAADIGAFF
jgi:hypothetical protein